MFAIDSAGHSSNQFVDRDPVNGVPGTVVSAEWLNALQGEILNVLGQFGVAPSKANSNQLSQIFANFIPRSFNTIFDFVSSQSNSAELTILGFSTPGVGGFKLIRTDTINGDPTNNTAEDIALALANGEIINALGVGYSLDVTDYMISPYTFGFTNASLDCEEAFSLCALAAQSYGKKEWWLPPGVWTASSVCSWVYGDMSLRGFGKSVSVIKIADGYANQSCLFDCIDASNCSVIDIGFDGNLTNQDIVDLTDNKQIGFILRGNSSNWKFVRTRFFNWGKDGIYIASTAQNNIEVDSDFENMRRNGVTIIAGKNITVRGHHKNGAASTNMIFNNAVHWEPNALSDTLYGLDVSVTCEDMQGGVVLYNANSADQHNINIHDCTFNNVTKRSAIVVYACGINPVGIHDNNGYECGNTESSSVMSDGGGITHENSVINAKGNTWINCGGYLGTVVNDGAGGRGSVYSGNVHIGDRRRAVYQGYVFGAASSGSLRHIEGNSFLAGGTDTANTFPAIEIKNTETHIGSGDVVRNNTIQTSNVSGYSTGVVIDYDNGTSICADNPMVGNGGRYTFNNGAPGKIGTPARGSITLSAAASRTVNNVNVLANSRIVLMPRNSAAATLMSGSKALYVSAIIPGISFTVATADGTNAAGTEDFDWFIN